MTEAEKAKAWRLARGLSAVQLAELSGYSVEAIYAMERGEAPPNRGKRQAGKRQAGKIKPWVWQRYKTCCAGVDRQLRSSVVFDWEG